MFINREPGNQAGCLVHLGRGSPGVWRGCAWEVNGSRSRRKEEEGGGRLLFLKVLFEF